ncbi:hypothetical protein GOBAR_AA20441 [Gossypium barbadense]|uniref:Uncharacterized protein n=1 Tax=Gossypium barbadense TaxID=3634 RepID=A0A2P5XA68_GOSBA|nr:hypothetical protein GOBAR_AA20441 [Gossypium barbadense]
MSSSCGKKTVVPASKKRKGAASSSRPTTEIRHPFFQVPLGPQEELYQILRVRPLVDLCSMFHLQTVMTNFDDPRTVQFCLGGLVRQLNVPEFGIALGVSTRHLGSHSDRETKEHQRRHHPRRLFLMDYGEWARHRPCLFYFPRGVISIEPYVTRLAQHFGLLNTAAQSSSLTLIGQMSPQGISSMLSMRMIEK